MIPPRFVIRRRHPYVIFFLIPTSTRAEGTADRDDDRATGPRGCSRRGAAQNQGTSFLALLFIRAVDRTISHADICLSKITFLLMPANVPRVHGTSTNRHGMQGTRYTRGQGIALGRGTRRWRREKKEGVEKVGSAPGSDISCLNVRGGSNSFFLSFFF